MLRLSRWIAVVAILLSTSVAFAQRPGGGQPGGGRPGGFGGGFGGGGPLSIVNNEAVQKELGLKEEQISKLKTLGDEVREDMRGAFAGGGDFQSLRDLPEEERNKKFAEMREKSEAAMKKVSEKFKPKVAEILDASQRDRLQQITLQNALQNSGAQAYQEADLVAKLKLGKDQQEKIAAIGKDFEAKRRDLFPRGGQAGGGERPNFEELRKKGQELSDARDKQLGEVLTADQKSELEKLKGKPFDLALLRPSFGGPGGGGGRPGQGGGGANPAGRPQRKTEGSDTKKDSK